VWERAAGDLHNLSLEIAKDQILRHSGSSVGKRCENTAGGGRPRSNSLQRMISSGQTDVPKGSLSSQSETHGHQRVCLLPVWHEFMMHNCLLTSEFRQFFDLINCVCWFSVSETRFL
jgi:hypothetical protein